MLRSVRGGSAVDLDSRALTTEDDLIDLDELYPPDDDHSHSDDETAQIERSSGRQIPGATRQREHGGPAPDSVADRAERGEEINDGAGMAGRSARVTGPRSADQPASIRWTTARGSD